MAKILVVDDEPDVEHLVRQTFRRRLRAGEISLVFAGNGKEALQTLEQEPDIDMILTDINMPVMDGLTLLEQLRGVDGVTKAVVVSAYGDMKNIRTAMNRGAFDFITKPIDRDDLQVTVDKTLTHLALMREALQSRDQLIAIRQELDVANRMQQSILPKRFPEASAYELYADMCPAKEIGGDFYDFFEISPTQVGFAIADVSGKGIAAAFFMAVSHTLLRASALAGLDPGDCLERVNRLLAVDNDAAMFVTVFYAVLETNTGQVTYANGGHNAPFHVDAAGAVNALPRTGGIALGVLPNAAYREETLALEPGETLFLYTDGVTEAFDATDNQFGEQRLADQLGASCMLSPRRMLEQVTEDVGYFAGDADQFDDITCLALRFAGPQTAPKAGEMATQPVEWAGSQPTFGDDQLRVVLENKHEEVRRLAGLIESFGEARGWPAKLMLDLNLAIDELITNTINYGYDDDDRHEILVTVGAGDGRVTTDIEDDAKAFDPTTAPKPDIDAPLEERAIGGLGVHIVKTLVDDMTYRFEDGRNRLRLEKAI